MTNMSSRDGRRVRPGYWFRPKRFGWGAVPVTWQGWLLTAALLAFGIAIAKLAEARTRLWLVLLIPLVLGYVALAWARTDGAWRFRWGDD